MLILLPLYTLAGLCAFLTVRYLCYLGGIHGLPLLPQRSFVYAVIYAKVSIAIPAAILIVVGHICFTRVKGFLRKLLFAICVAIGCVGLAAVTREYPFEAASVWAVTRFVIIRGGMLVLLWGVIVAPGRGGEYARGKPGRGKQSACENGENLGHSALI